MCFFKNHITLSDTLKSPLLLLGLLLLFATNLSAQPDSLKQRFKAQPADISIKLKMANALAAEGKTDTAQILYNQILYSTTYKTNPKPVVTAGIKLGRLYADKGENVKALAQYQRALKLADEVGDKNLAAHIYKNIGAVYISWKKFNDALYYYDKAEALAKAVNDQELIADCQNNKGTVYEQQQKYNEAIVAYKNALAVYTQNNIPAKIAMALSNVAIVYKFQKNYKASILYNLKALALSGQTKDKWMMAATLNNIGNLYGEMGDYIKAVNYCKQSIALANQINAIEIVQSAYESLADAAAKAGDFKSAYNYQKQFTVAKDKFINLESEKQLSELNVKFETERKQKLIQQQEFDISRRNNTIIIIVALFVIALIIGYQLYSRYKLKQVAILQNEVIKQQDLATKGIIDAEEKERKRIAADLHDGVGQLFSAVRLNLGSLLERVLLHNPEEDALAEKTLAMVDESCKEVRTIAHQMMPNVLLKTGLTTAIRGFLNKIDAHQLKVNLEAYGLNDRLDSNVETVLYRVVQECVNNVIKHSGATRLDINLARETNHVSVTIEDNGKGFDAGERNAFEGIGLKNIITRVQYLKGTVDISSAVNKGTLIAIYVPFV